MNPDVSVIIPAWNAEATLRETVTSVTRQSHTALEIFIVDDGSTDRTADIASDLASADPRITLIRQDNAGVAAARNAGLARARGVWAAWLDADDLWHPAKIARQLAAAAQAGQPPAFVYTGYRMVDADGRIFRAPRTLADISGHTLCRQIATTYFTHPSSLMAPVALARAGGGHDPGLRAAGMEGAEDMLLQLRLAMQGPAVFVPGALVGYRIHSTNMSRAVARAARSNLRALELIEGEAGDVPPWVFRLGRARTVGFALQMAAAGNPGAALTHLGRLLRQQPRQTAGALARAGAWVAGDGLGLRPKDSAVGQLFRDADPGTVPVEGHMLLSPTDRRRLEDADAARMRAKHAVG